MKPDCHKWILFKPQLVQPPAFLNHQRARNPIGSYIGQLAKIRKNLVVTWGFITAEFRQGGP